MRTHDDDFFLPEELTERNELALLPHSKNCLMKTAKADKLLSRLKVESLRTCIEKEPSQALRKTMLMSQAPGRF